MKWRFKESIVRLAKLHNTPHEVALGVAIGVFIAILPVYGLHTLLMLLAIAIIRPVNKIAILVGTNISLPPTLPFITWAGYNIGRLILGAKKYPQLSHNMFKGLTYKSISSFYYPLLLGSFLLGLICAIIFYFLTRWFMNKRMKVRQSV